MSRHLLVVEGKDDKCFIESLMRHHGIDDRSIEIYCSEGKYQIPRQLELLVKSSDFLGRPSLAVIRDADDDCDPFSSVANVFNRLGLPRPACESCWATGPGKPSTAIVIIRRNLEEICLRSVQDEPVMKCVNRYFECLDSLVTSEPECGSRDKARVQVYLAAGKPHLSLGSAAARGCWPLNSPVFQPLVTFLSGLASVGAGTAAT